LAHVGGGAVWEAVDKAAIPHGLATTAGAVNHTGVGGLTLGGGFGWLCGVHGLAVDNLVQATMVTADGSILTASETENSDLFWAIRGGGSNFGVCTEFVFKLHPQRRTVYAGVLIFPTDALDRLVVATNEWWAKGPSEKEAMVHALTHAPDGMLCFVVFLLYHGTEAEGRQNFKAFLDLGPVMDTTAEIPYEVLNSLQNPFATPGRCGYMKSTYYRETEPISYRQVFERYMELCTNDDFSCSIVYELYPLKKINSVPKGTCAFNRSPCRNVGTVVYWKENKPENFEYGRNMILELMKVVSEERKVNGIVQNGYGNYDSEGTRDSAASLFGENYPRLQEIKKKYDPGLVFSKWFAIEPQV